MSGQEWLNRTESRDEVIAPFPSNALAATLDRPDPPYGEGSALPPLWHWLHYLPISPMSEAGPDGHPKKGGFLPPIDLPRRMWAGSRLVFHKPLRIGEATRRVSTIARIEEKSGRSGRLAFVTVHHALSGPGGLAIDEEHDIVYREAAVPGAPAPAPVAAPPPGDWARPIRPDEVLLFRYSALTFNSHRIHYDLAYATGVEGYPGLIVHGPLIATLLLDGLRRARPEATVTRFTFRALAPIFHIDAFEVCGAFGEGGSVRLWAQKGGALCMEATAEIV